MLVVSYYKTIQTSFFSYFSIHMLDTETSGFATILATNGYSLVDW